MENSVQPVADDPLPKQFVRLPDWHAREGGGLFATFGSLQWFVRQYRKQLVDEGALIIRAGPGGTFCGPNFGPVAVKLLRNDSAANV